MKQILSVEGLHKRFGRTVAVDGVGFSINANERTAMIGPNGAGKSTLFEILGGALACDAGRVRFAETDITGIPATKRARLGIARTFQIAAVFRSMSVRENVQMALLATAGWPRPYGRANAAFTAEADELLETVGIGGTGNRPIGELAYGDVKRVELAMALATKPKLLLLDEPTAGMAAAERRRIMETTIAVADRSRMSLFFTEHDMDTVFGFAGRVLVMSEGRIVADGTPDAVRADAEVKRIYLGTSSHA